MRMKNGTTQMNDIRVERVVRNVKHSRSKLAHFGGGLMFDATRYDTRNAFAVIPRVE